jgi:hypothetical protein
LKSTRPENLRKIVNHLKVCSPYYASRACYSPPIDEAGRKEHAQSVYGEKATELPERTNEVTELYAKQCIALAKEMGLRSIDLW